MVSLVCDLIPFAMTRDGHETSMAETETRPRRDVQISRRDRDETFAGLETCDRDVEVHVYCH